VYAVLQHLRQIGHTLEHPRAGFLQRPRGCETRNPASPVSAPAMPRLGLLVLTAFLIGAGVILRRQQRRAIV
jgi:hypothetical protein